MQRMQKQRLVLRNGAGRRGWALGIGSWLWCSGMNGLITVFTGDAVACECCHSEAGLWVGLTLGTKTHLVSVESEDCTWLSRRDGHLISRVNGGKRMRSRRMFFSFGSPERPVENFCFGDANEIPFSKASMRGLQGSCWPCDRGCPDMSVERGCPGLRGLRRTPFLTVSLCGWCP
ncbi:hypothetical protein CRG98_046364 [Punica granatum]|uniref:Uncharacterized protein n=1 Tax=Punica granatum TaxID=22663 RepID=A0A2I0HNE2_PUNGR|nr:hypothetical protein CRG98_046364 [Punica granatum]